MILYNITVNVENSVAEEWLDWMIQVHIPEVMATGYFLRNQVSRLLNEVENGGVTYAVQFFCRNLEDLEEYQRDHAPALQDKHTRRYGEKALSFRSLLEIIGTDVERK
ncbi:DUF4286 family protein [Pontibacter qinzhouensis]|uniref:DUF4286 family protein n=1 Tax=Pontibacter qinzhouensis TaxID=2603253 RepID=A0A5C8KCM6_9BACT|nr:DUF4286 family protein [Pontibacter qinzhouensis]TXK51974.1 DUF4286 family protein [Pontibacter qinzhouensis]